MKRRLFFARYAKWILACFALASPLIVYSAVHTMRSNSNKVQDWLPATFAETHDLAAFREFFAADQFVIVSWEGCRLGGNPADPNAAPDDPRIERLARMLTSSDLDDSPGPDAQIAPRFFGSVTTGRRVLEQLTSPPISVPHDVAVERLKGSLIGPDGRQTCLIVTLTDEALAHLRDAIGRGGTRPLRTDDAPGALFQAVDACGIPAESVHVGGPPVDNVAIDEEGERTLLRLAGLSGLLGLVLAWWSLRSIKLTLIVFSTGLWSALSGLAAVWLTGENSDALLMSMPALVYVLAVSGAIHIINYYRGAVDEDGVSGAPERAIIHAWKPALLCSLTTAFGLLSLCASDLEPIRKFGLYSAVGVLLMLGVLLLFLPAALQVWPVAPRNRRRPGGALGENSFGGGADASRADRIWRGFGSLVIRRHAIFAIGCLLAVIAVGWGITRTRTSVDLLKLFDSKSQILADYRWLEEHLGRLIPMEVVLRFSPETQRPEPGQETADDLPNESRASAAGMAEQTGEPFGRLSFLDRMEVVSVVQQSIERQLGPGGRNLIGRTLSAITFAPELPSQSGATLNYVRRSAINRRLTASRQEFEESGYFRIDPADGSELWRISLRVAAFEDVDFGQFVEDLQQAVEPVLAADSHRSEVLRAIASKRVDGRAAGANVLLWQRIAGAPVPMCDDADPPSVSGSPVGVSKPASTDSVVAASMRTFLRRDRLRVAETRQDPDDLPQATLDRLRAFDAVVLAGEFDSEEINRIRGAAGRVVISAPPPSMGHSSAGASRRADAEITATYTGVVPIVYKTQRVLLASLVESTFWSFVTITPLMMLVCRGVAAGAVAMLPNVLPVLVIFGGMGWLALPIDIGSMMAASIALGVAVDDTIHYLAWFRGDLASYGNRPLAILCAYRRCAMPTLQTALVNGLGLSVFIFSTFTPTRQFGFLMLTILLAGVVAELVMLPALLAGPLGRAFDPRPSVGTSLRRWRFGTSPKRGSAIAARRKGVRPLFRGDAGRLPPVACPPRHAAANARRSTGPALPRTGDDSTRH